MQNKKLLHKLLWTRNGIGWWRSSNYLKNQLVRDAWRRRDQLWKKFLFGAKRQASFAYRRVNILPNFTSPCLFHPVPVHTCYFPVLNRGTTVFFSTNEFIAQSIAKTGKVPEDSSWRWCNKGKRIFLTILDPESWFEYANQRHILMQNMESKKKFSRKKSSADDAWWSLLSHDEPFI